MCNRIFKIKMIRFYLLLLLLALPAIAEVRLIRENRQTKLELWDSSLGQLWIPTPGSAVIKHLEWEQAIQKIYDHPSAHASSGDIVIDCGAHIGGFTRTALLAKARLVVAVEPEKLNAAAFRKNFAEELKTGRVILIEKGIWNKTGSISLHLSSTGDSHSVAIAQNLGKEQIIEVTTLDALVKDLNLPRVDFIKLDIEGAELNALQGGGQVIKRWRPRLAVSSYHKKGDPSAICTLVWDIQPNYLVGSKDRVRGPEGVEVPKVLFFY